MANREEQIENQLHSIEDNPNKEGHYALISKGVNYFDTGFILGAKWADSHPNGFINEEKYLNRLWERKDITNKEFIEILKTFPEDAEISIECCNPRAMVYDEENNLIRID